MFTQVLFLLLIILVTIDAVTTIKILSKGGVEKNLLMKWLFDRLGVIPTMVVMKGGGLAIIAATLDFIPPLLLVIACAWFMFVSARNIRTLVQ